ncbi:protein MpVPT [Marchantia polymorpha subsp. ruderalis]|uniref:SPX domain-containing protein n=1 Tax=Marchantia polymorpha TaxID=3197 RepID=A0A2R6WG73_MARPO|nr:hypothetical protein MARPO_0094s0020 [Marchantia polymorpha]PTQ32843.1 hypothetical protein MARPO_0094s0020 [Marchantia polymorpha]BBN02718.1 hypothetical protein Mp_2g17520 [Marchantia polymorpha subsp. ruderalis]BBN02719.1 hypothetical protein Mp_2g17520 [Marchantia polymorpha subsp. ruderalis]|eukprot:PTQ32842.1 hypothetical protein MARPO_0094s0020 [Marchantia polymorpha]
MVGFGKKLRERQIPEWEQYYISYKMMKKKLKDYAIQASISKDERQRVLKEFSLMLDRQVEKTVLFLLDQQGRLAQRLANLANDRIAIEDQEDDGDQTDELTNEYRAVGKDLLKLLHFVEVNATGLRKILKKFDKRVGYRLTDDYVASRSNHPYSQLQQVFKHVGIGAMVATLSRNLAELQSTKSMCIYELPSTPSFYSQEPVIKAIKAAEDRLTNSTNFLRFLGQAALLPREDLPRVISADDLQEGEEPYDFLSLALNLGNTFLYMVNTYIIVPTADKYTVDLHVAPTVCGVVIGSMAVAQLVSSVYFSAWSNSSYYQPLVFSSVMLLLGNICYAVAYDYRSISLLIIGRLLCGFGSARAVNRRYISDCVPLKMRLQASAAFVSASALGMAAGPGMAGLLTYDTTILGYTINDNTLPGWVMAIGWLLYLVLLCVGFKEPKRSYNSPKKKSKSKPSPDPSIRTSQRSGSAAEDGLLDPLILAVSVSDSALSNKDSESDDERSDEPASSIGEAYRLLTAPVKVQLLIYFMLKFSMEILLSESSVVTAYYFDWGIHHVSLFLGLLGLTVLPINYVVGSYFSNIFEDRQILLFSEIATCVGIVISFSYTGIRYTMTQYVSGALLIFVSAEVLEGVNLSLLSKVMSSRLARGTFNGGLLSTEAGTLARVVADVSITLAGYLGSQWLLNATLLPTLVVGLVSIAATLATYNSMF